MVRKIWNHFEEYLLVGSLAFSVALVFLQVVMRYVFQQSLSWSEELARYLFLWQIWIGASFAVKERRHLRIEMLLNALRGRSRILGEMAVLLVWFGFSVFLAYKGTELTSILLLRGQVSPAMRIPMGYAYAAVPAGCILMAIRLLEELHDLFRTLASKEEGS
jgi:TRAP-type C4-dicarboxylate transport system permease small subunit